MRALFLLLLTCSVIGETEAFFNIFGDLIGGIWDFFMKTIDKFVQTGLSIGGKIIGTVVDPFGIWKPAADDHGHKDGKVVKCPAIADIIFVFDTSSSMSQKEFQLQKEFATRLTEHFTIGRRDVRFGAITFSDTVQKYIGLADFSDNASLKAKLAAIPYLGGGTKTYHALDYIRVERLFSTTAGGRDQSSKIVVVITDGASDNHSKTKIAADNLKAEGLRIISVGIGTWFWGQELANIASGSNNVFKADSFNDLVRIEYSVALRTCAIPQADGNVPKEGSGKCKEGFVQNPNNPERCIDVNECQSSNPCQQVCVNTVGAFRCTCRSGYVVDASATTKCKEIKACSHVGDIIYLIDSSGSIGSDKYQIQKEFASKLTTHFKYGSAGVLFGAVLFSTDVQKLFDLNTHSSQSAVSQALLASPYLEGGTNTHLALNYILDQKLFAKGRSNVPKTLIVFTDGLSSRPDETAAAATKLKAQGVRTIAVGIGVQISADELVKIASSNDDVFAVADFDYLDYIQETLAKRLCT